jgi:hypothetical protein
MDTKSFRRFETAGVQMIPVATPGHPLAAANEAATPPSRDFVQLVLSDQPTGEGQDFGVVSLDSTSAT